MGGMPKRRERCDRSVIGTWKEVKENKGKVGDI